MTLSIHTGRFAQDDHVVDALASDRADESFGEAVLPRRARGDERVADAHGSQSVPDGSAVDLIPICGSGSAGPHSKGMPS
jgi:hypothetical protein